MAIAGGSYQAAYQAANDQATQQRLLQGWYNNAESVYNEGSGVTGHAARAAFATRILTGQVDVNSLIRSVTAQGITAASTDANIDTVIASVYNALAGA